MALVFIGLGTNLGRKKKNLSNAVKSLKSGYNINIQKKSSIKKTAPVDYIDQPEFLNQVVLARTEHTPEELLAILQEIEAKLGRTPSAPKGPRIIDLDILLFDNLILNTKILKIPHPEIKNRKFILEHLVELDPDIIDPLSGQKYIEFLK